jgi:hypothetical protein
MYAALYFKIYYDAYFPIFFALRCYMCILSYL